MVQLDGHKSRNRVTYRLPIDLDLGEVALPNNNLHFRLRLRGTVLVELVDPDRDRRNETCDDNLNELDLIVTPGVGATPAAPPVRKSRSDRGPVDLVTGSSSARERTAKSSGRQRLSKKPSGSGTGSQKRLIAGDGQDGTVPRTLKNLLERFLTAKNSQRSLATSTAKTYGYHVASLSKGLGSLDLMDLRRERIEEYADSRLEAGKSPATVQGETNVLRMALHYGIKRGWCQFDIESLCLDMDLGVTPEKRWLRAEEVPGLLQAVDRNQNGTLRDPRLGIAVRLALFAGLRAGEVATRQWKDVDWEGGLLTVGQKSGDGWSWRTKNGKARFVPMSADLRSALRKWWMRLGQPDPDGWVVPTQDGKRRRTVTWFRNSLLRACKRAGIKPVAFHGLRHSFASLALEAEVPLLEVSRILGHQSPEFTARQYAHVAERRLVASADRLGEYLRRQAGKAG